MKTRDLAVHPNDRRRRLRRLFVARASLLLVGVLALSCKQADSLLQIDLQSETAFAYTEVALSVNGSVPKVFSGVTVGPAQVFRAGIYVPGTLSGTADVDAIVYDAASGACLAKGAVSVFGVAAGRIVPPVALTLAPQPGVCEGGAPSIPDASVAGSGGQGGAADGTGGGPAAAGAGGGTAGGVGLGGSAPGTGGRGGGAGGTALGTGGLPLGSGGTIVVATGGMIGSGGVVASSGGMAGSGGATGSGGAVVVGCGITPELVDDFEDGDGIICASNGRSGHWFTYVDSGASSSITPSPSDAVAAVPTKLSMPRGASQYAMHITGSDSSYAGVGVLLNNPVIGEVPGVFDATGAGYSGVHFFIKSSTGLDFVIQIPATIAVKYGGTCASEPCAGAAYFQTSVALPSSAAWTEITVPFSSLMDGVAPFRADQLWNLGFQPGTTGAFDLWIDDVSFY